eukprot:CAMPEP_0178370010 /NCGR_PEP_ID=MMETSP0689_2-20121128/75_1 /TAXON_ID=160604 /ORGANISM="Amphidinium massartii, Strain CS-259" /LENGTH=1095 /DNA_ID=CAMNT_0019989805 /DNA_START=37 /DNA_END=3324 /DNA_ORIENTATION=-
MAEGHEETLLLRLNKMQGQLETLCRGQMRMENTLDELSSHIRHIPENLTSAATVGGQSATVVDSILDMPADMFAPQVTADVDAPSACRSPIKSPVQHRSPTLGFIEPVSTFNVDSLPDRAGSMEGPIRTQTEEMMPEYRLREQSPGGQVKYSIGATGSHMASHTSNGGGGGPGVDQLYSIPTSPRASAEHRHSSAGSRRSRASDMSLRPHEALSDVVRKSRSRRVNALTRLKQSQEERAHHGRLGFPVHPTSWVRVLFDVCGFIVLSYDALMVPLVLAWDIDIAGLWAIIAWIAVIFWILDMGLNFVTGYVEDGTVVMNLTSVWLRYIRTGFIPDAVLIGCELTGLIISLGSGKASQQLVVLRAARLAKISRAVRIMAKLRMGLLQKMDHMLIFGMNRAGMTNKMQVMQFGMQAVRFAFFILWLNHVGSCLLFGLSSVFQSDTGRSWLEDINETNPSSQFQYLQGLYWSAASMFSGACPNQPTNSWEAVFAELYLVSSALFVTCVTASLAARLIESQLSGQEQTKAIRKLNKYLLQHKTEPMLAIAIRNQFFSRMRQQRRLSEIDLPFLRLLSAQLRSDLRYHLYGKRFLHTPFFRMCDTLEHNIIREVCFYAASPMLAQPGEEIIVPRCVVEHAFILLQGNMQYFSGPAKHIQDVIEVEPDHCVCELAIYSAWKAVGTLQTHPESSSWSEVLKIGVESFLKLLTGYSHVLAVAASYAQKVCEFLRREDPESLELTDMDTFVPCDIVISSLSAEARGLLSQAVLQSIKRPRHYHLSDSEDLTKDLDGHVLMRSYPGDPYCIRRQVELHMTSPSGLVLVFLAEWRDGVAISRLGLPSMPVPGDENEDTIVEMLVEDLGILSRYVEVSSQQMQVVDEGYRLYGMATKCVRIVQHGVIDLRLAFAEALGVEGTLLCGDSSSNLDDTNDGEVDAQVVATQEPPVSPPAMMQLPLQSSDLINIFGLGIPSDAPPRSQRSWYRPFGAFIPGSAKAESENGVKIYGWITMAELQDLNTGHSRCNELLPEWLRKLTASNIESMRLDIDAMDLGVASGRSAPPLLREKTPESPERCAERLRPDTLLLPHEAQAGNERRSIRALV